MHRIRIHHFKEKLVIPHSSRNGRRMENGGTCISNSNGSRIWRSTVILLLLFSFHSAATEETIPPIVGGLSRSENIDPVLAGRVLLSELNCTACHQVNLKHLTMKGGPKLEGIGHRVGPNYLKALILDPGGTKPGTTMPQVLGHLPEAEQEVAADALVHYLVGDSHVTEDHRPEDQAESIQSGRRIYYSVGCVACHSPEDSLSGSVPLPAMEEKYSHSGLVSFLLDPLAIRPSGRMPDLHLSHKEANDLASYLLRNGKAEKKISWTFDKDLFNKGKSLFQEYRCDACHSGDVTGDISQELALESLSPNSGCLSEQAQPGPHPFYPLSKTQKEDIRVALRALSKPLRLEENIRMGLTQFNCIACHRYGEYGGIPENRDAHFTGQDPNLGEQGRLPPPLAGIGSKLKPEWLRRTLVQGSPSRPYLNTRMPKFPAGPLESLIQLLSMDAPLADIPPIRFSKINEAKRAGRDLTGNQGLNCITCHTFKDRKTGAMGALDLTLVAQRLNRNWFHQYLMKPQLFSPDTLMPRFWIEGNPPKPEILDGKPDRQIEALWLYLSEGYSAGEPRGLRREPMRLLAKADEAVMLRRKYPNIGKRGIGVGYPGGVNLVYNAEQLCLSLIWQGSFVDPSGVWRSQGHGSVHPLTRNSFKFPQTPELFYLDEFNSPWPTIEGRPQNHSFKGYRLDAKRRPTFRFQYEDSTIEDGFVDVPDEESGRNILRRTIHFDTLDPKRLPVFRAAVHSNISATGRNAFRIGDQMEIRIRTGQSFLILNHPEISELRIDCRPLGNESRLVLDYVWTKGSD